jgi:hypothetical protein
MGIQVDPKNVIGRDGLISQIWDMLRRPPEQGSLRFLAERRVGKTTIITKMATEPPPEFDVVFLEVEGVDSCDHFTELLINRFRPLFNKVGKAQSHFDSIWQALGGTEIGGVIKLPERRELSWQASLEKVIDGVCINRPDRLILMMIDELPYMLQKINLVSEKAGRHYEALTLLDTFRALRQRNRNLRMIYCGSVGLHHVLRDLRQARLAAEPVNNMPPVEIPPLAVDDAILLAKRLLKDERVRFDGDVMPIANTLIDQTSSVPFYMERIATQLGLLGRSITTSDVEEVVLKQLTSDHDPWEMEHFRTRLDIYYQGSVLDTNNRTVLSAAIARTVLDHFATVDTPQTIDQIWSMIRSQYAFTDRILIVEMLKSLGQDHYLISDTEKRYSFRFPLVKRWWKLAQGL